MVFQSPQNIRGTIAVDIVSSRDLDRIKTKITLKKFQSSLFVFKELVCRYIKLNIFYNKNLVFILFLLVQSYRILCILS